MADSSANRIFSKSRIANVMSAIMILSCIWFIAWVMLETFTGGGIVDAHKDMILALIATTSMIGGFALRYLFEEPCPHCSRE